MCLLGRKAWFCVGARALTPPPQTVLLLTPLGFNDETPAPGQKATLCSAKRGKGKGKSE